MKVGKEILRYIISIILALSIFVLLMCSFFTKTILNKDYIKEAALKSNYYDYVYNLAYENFSTYIMQSGFDEDIFKDIVTNKKVIDDVNIIFDNIYDGTNYEVETQVVADNLSNNINKFLENTEVKAESSSLRKFSEVIVEQYVYAINYHPSVFGTINKGIVAATFGVKTASYILGVVAIIFAVLLVLVNRKRFDKFLSCVGIVFFFMSLLSIAFKIFLSKLVNIELLMVLNVALTSFVKYLLEIIFNRLLIYGIVFGIIGLCLIFVGSFLQNKNQVKQE